MSRQALDDLLFVLTLVLLVFILVLVASPDLVADGIEWVIA